MEGVGQRICPLCGCWEHLLMNLTVSCMDCSCIILLGRGQFVFLLPKEEIKASAGHLLSPCGFWVCTARCHWDLGSFCVPEHLRLQSRAAAKSHVQQDMDARASGRSTHCKVKKAFPRLHQLHKPVGAAAITVTPMSHFVCKLWVASPFFGGESSGGKQGNLDFVPTLALQFFPSCPLLPHLLRCPPGEGPFPAYTEIKATVLGGISDCCYNISIFSGHEPVCKMQFLITSRFFQKAKLARPNPTFSNWIKPAFKKGGKKVQGSDCRLVLIIENSQHAMFNLPFSGKGFGLLCSYHHFPCIFGLAAAWMRTF